MADTIFGIFLFYMFIGTFSLIIINEATKAYGLEFVNPIWLYKKYKINWFGAMVLIIIFTALTLPFALAYWFYKLCTVGRK